MKTRVLTREQYQCTTDHSAKYNSLTSFCFSFLMDEKTQRRCDQTSQKQICWAGSSRLGLLRSPFTRVVLSQTVRPYSPARPRRPPSAVLPSRFACSYRFQSGWFHRFRYGPESQPERLFSVKAHKESCRAVRFVDSGKVILSGSADCSVLASDIESGKAIARLEDAHENAINRLVCLTESTIATGDDEGCIKVWDTRERSCCNSFEVHDDYISDMTYVADSNQILATSGDGTLSVNSLRRNKVRSRSEFSEDELLSLVVMKNGKKVVCGTPSGALLLYSWGYFKDCSDRFLGHTQSVDTMLKLDEETLVSGSSDGVIRLVGILPNRIIQPLAEHSEYPIEALAFSNDKKYLGSISHDKMLKLWDLEELLNGPQVVNGDEPAEAGSDDSDDDSDDDAMDVDMAATSSKGSRSKKVGKGQSSSRPASDFFADL